MDFMRKEIINGRQRIIINYKTSGEDKTREAVLAVMGPGWVFKDKEENSEK